MKVMCWIDFIIDILGQFFNWQPEEPLTEADRRRRVQIHPYRKNGDWVFDDPRVGLKEELLMEGVPEMIEVFRKRKRLGKKITIVFSASEFKGCDMKLKWARRQSDGNWYYSPKLDMECWLCSALFRYYPSAPEELFIKIQARKRAK